MGGRECRGVRVVSGWCECGGGVSVGVGVHAE